MGYEVVIRDGVMEVVERYGMYSTRRKAIEGYIGQCLGRAQDLHQEEVECYKLIERAQELQKKEGLLDDAIY